MVAPRLVLVAALLTIAAAPPVTRRTVVVPPPVLSATTLRYVKTPAGALVLRGVRLIDGTGAPLQTNRTIVIDGAEIAAVGGPDLPLPIGAHVLDLPGRTVMPGIVGMHDHLFYIARPGYEEHGQSEPPLLVPQMSFSAPRLYLAAGVTTIRTAGSVEPYADFNLKHQIDSGAIPGPRTDVTGPYLEGRPGRFVQMHQVSGAAEARAFVQFWAAQGATSVKLYINVTRAEAGAAITEAHRLGMKVTGHLCAISYAEAIALGIDNIEHGFFSDTADDPDKRPDACPPTVGVPTLQRRDASGPEAAALIAALVAHHVAITSTLPVFAAMVPGRSGPGTEALAMLTPRARAAVEAALAVRDSVTPEAAAAARARFATGMALERRFVAAGGLLLAGPDPTGNGAVLPGFGDLAGIQLLVEAGFTVEAAVRIATLNGAIYLGLDDRLGSIAAGKRADLIVIDGDPVHAIADIKRVETVFKDGVGYDPVTLRASVKEQFGAY